MLSIGMALMAGPRLMLLDEPSVGLSPLYVETIMDAIRGLADELRVGVVMLEQNVTQALRVADRVYVMRSGETIAHETPTSSAPESICGTCSESKSERVVTNKRSRDMRSLVAVWGGRSRRAKVALVALPALCLVAARLRCCHRVLRRQLAESGSAARRQDRRDRAAGRQLHQRRRLGPDLGRSQRHQRPRHGRLPLHGEGQLRGPLLEQRTSGAAVLAPGQRAQLRPLRQRRAGSGLAVLRRPGYVPTRHHLRSPPDHEPADPARPRRTDGDRPRRHVHQPGHDERHEDRGDDHSPLDRSLLRTGPPHPSGFEVRLLVTDRRSADEGARPAATPTTRTTRKDASDVSGAGAHRPLPKGLDQSTS